MVCKTIHAADPNFPANLFKSEEDTEDTTEASNSNRIPLSCCSYGTYAAAIYFDWETEIDE
jgi:hypothetical protein